MSEENNIVLPPTEMLYMTYRGNWLTECDAKILSVQKGEGEGKAATTIVLDKTVLHAQGGGQPTDVGNIVVRSDDTTKNVVAVDKVMLNRSTGVATHAISPCETTTQHLPMVGDSVRVVLNEERRRILSECHTAGHVVDSAMARCDFTLKPTKAYHFLDSPYVEYAGSIPPEEREDVLSRLQVAFCELVDESLDTEIELLSKEDADKRCNRQAQNFDMDVFLDPRSQTVRVVTVAGFACPCGGTHVKSTSDLKSRQWGISGLKSKKGVVRVKYGQGVDDKR